MCLCVFMKLLLTVCGVSYEPKSSTIVYVAAAPPFAWDVLVTSVEGHHQRSVAVYHASFVSNILLSVVAVQNVTNLSATTTVLIMAFLLCVDIYFA